MDTDELASALVKCERATQCGSIYDIRSRKIGSLVNAPLPPSSGLFFNEFKKCAYRNICDTIESYVNSVKGSVHIEKSSLAHAISDFSYIVFFYNGLEGFTALDASEKTSTWLNQLYPLLTTHTSHNQLLDPCILLFCLSVCFKAIADHANCHEFVVSIISNAPQIFRQKSVVYHIFQEILHLPSPLITRNHSGVEDVFEAEREFIQNQRISTEEDYSHSIQVIQDGYVQYPFSEKPISSVKGPEGSTVSQKLETVNVNLDRVNPIGEITIRSDYSSFIFEREKISSLYSS